MPPKSHEETRRKPPNPFRRVYDIVLAWHDLYRTTTTGTGGWYAGLGSRSYNFATFRIFCCLQNRCRQRLPDDNDRGSLRRRPELCRRYSTLGLGVESLWCLISARRMLASGSPGTCKISAGSRINTNETENHEGTQGALLCGYNMQAGNEV